MALAIIPGSLVGALPPMAGWAAAGGSLTDDKILLFYLADPSLLDIASCVWKGL